MASLNLQTEKNTRILAKWFADHITEYGLPSLLLKGPLGCGKTTFSRFLANSLPGAENAEITSPSFTICNIYPTSPPIFHCDLYRCQNDIPEEIYEALDNKNCLTLVEWAEFLPVHSLPKEYLDINFILDNDSRLLTLNAYGEKSEQMLAALELDWRNYYSRLVNGL